MMLDALLIASVACVVIGIIGGGMVVLIILDEATAKYSQEDD
jgi:hypothetical protein